MGGAKKPEFAKVLCANSGSDVEWLMDKSNLDLSRVARLGSHSAPRNPSRQGAFARHDHHLCRDSDGGESCQKDRQGEDRYQSTCYTRSIFSVLVSGHFSLCWFWGTRTKLTMTVGLGLCSAVSFDVPYDSLFTTSELTALKPWSEVPAGESLPVQLQLMISLAFFPSPRWSSPQRSRGWSGPQERQWV